MSKSTANIFQNHIDVIEEDIHHSSKKIQLEKNVMTSNIHILETKSWESSQEMLLTCA